MSFTCTVYQNEALVVAETTSLRAAVDTALSFATTDKLSAEPYVLMFSGIPHHTITERTAMFFPEHSLNSLSALQEAKDYYDSLELPAPLKVLLAQPIRLLSNRIETKLEA